MLLKVDALTYEHLGTKFSTPDQDNDLWGDGSCAGTRGSGWWWGSCHGANLNGVYYHGGYYANANNLGEGVIWYFWKSNYAYSLRFAEMKFRPFSM